MAKKASGRPGSPPSSASSESDPSRDPFTPEVIDSLDPTVIALPLLERIKEQGESAIQNIIIDLNLEYPGGRKHAREVVWGWIDGLPGVTKTQPLPGPDRSPPPGSATIPRGEQLINPGKSAYSEQYLFGKLSGTNIRALVGLNEVERKASKEKSGGVGAAPLYRVWVDHEIKRLTNLSISTVKADAAHNAFSAFGKDIIWAVVDTGVDSSHPHFKKHRNLALGPPLRHRDFTDSGATTEDQLEQNACRDVAGHGTHVAGIIAGEYRAESSRRIVATVRRRDEQGNVQPETIDDIAVISGMAPQCKILSLKVLDDNRKGLTSNLIAALEYIQELNGNGRRIRVHGVNMSVGYDFEPKWFACGQSPLCVEVDRMVRSGVVVVVAAGNTGYGFNQSMSRGPVAAGQDLTINDPGNAELAITVGATHRDMPHIYGVSYFSSKGPTGDGRLKPDMVAPGEKIISCESSRGKVAVPAEAGNANPAPAADVAYYKEDSGTSMAAPHVSGVIAAFLSVRREFIGRPDTVKDVFMSSATDLKRSVYFQGKGLVDLMRAIQSI